MRETTSARRSLCAVRANVQTKLKARTERRAHVLSRTAETCDVCRKREKLAVKSLRRDVLSFDASTRRSTCVQTMYYDVYTFHR